MTTSALVWLGLSALAAWLVTFLVGAWSTRLGELLGTIDRPRPGEVQRRPVPRTGGYAMLLGLWCALGLMFVARPADLPTNREDDVKLLGMLLGTLAIVPLALWDDRRRLGPWPQLVGQLVIAVIPVLFGLRLGSIATPLGFVYELPAWLDPLLTVLWIVGMINAVNLVDVMDGLAGGIAAIASLVLCLRMLWFDQLSIAVLPLILLAASLGFLQRNFHPASVFMGSSGALLLGFWLATTSVVGGAKLGTAFVVLGLPILDTAWVILRRLAAGRSPFRGGDEEHLPHRLHAIGLSQLQTVLLLYGFSAVFGALALTLHSPAAGAPFEKLYLVVGMVLSVGAVIGFATAARPRKPR